VNRTDRLMAILLDLQARGELRAADLAERFEVSVRTIYRDMEGLAEGGVPLVATPGKGYRLIDGYFLPPLSLTSAEAGVLVLGAEFVRDRVDPELGRAADEALRKLESIFPEEQRQRVEHWRRELLFPRTTRADQKLLGPIRAALEERRVLRIQYHAYRRPAPETRDVEPISLYFLAEAWHLAAFCRTRQAPRFFRLDRIDELTVLEERFIRSELHLAPARTEPPLLAEARVRFDPAVVRWVRERQPYMFLREEAELDGPVFVYALRDAQALVSWLLGWGARAELLDPMQLRMQLADEARAIYLKHAGENAVGATDRIVSGGLLQAIAGA
jgi:predicted DNA-binding transcriptional regulator YafY